MIDLKELKKNAIKAEIEGGWSDPYSLRRFLPPSPSEVLELIAMVEAKHG